VRIITTIVLAGLLGGCVTQNSGVTPGRGGSITPQYLRADGRPVAEGHLRIILPQCQQEANNASTEFMTAGAGAVPFFAGMATSQSKGDTAMAACMGRNGYYLAQ
jgi:hypothetical protein